MARVGPPDGRLDGGRVACCRQQGGVPRGELPNAAEWGGRGRQRGQLVQGGLTARETRKFGPAAPDPIIGPGTRWQRTAQWRR